MAAPTTTARGGGLSVSVISPERTIYEGTADSVVVPAWDGELGVLRGHAPLMALLKPGRVRIRRGGETEMFEINGGFLQVIDNNVSVLSESAAGT